MKIGTTRRRMQRVLWPWGVKVDKGQAVPFGAFIVIEERLTQRGYQRGRAFIPTSKPYWEEVSRKPLAEVPA